jgi:flagellar biosynthesis protein FlhF
MNLQTFRGRDLHSVFAQAVASLGDDAMVVRSGSYDEDGVALVEIVAARAAEVEALRRRLESAPLPLGSAHVPMAGAPFVLALVGPTGAGKTTTIAKLAVNPRAFGGRRVGLLTLDTYRVGAVEQLGTFAEIAGLPMEVVYGPGDVREARKRLASCEVILVDTPGRSPRLAAGEREWGEALAALEPDEVHLTLPASLRFDLARSVRELFEPRGVTHVLLTKLDEVPGEAGIADLAARAELPARWVADGQEVPADLRSAGPRILASLGARPTGWAA